MKKRINLGIILIFMVSLITNIWGITAFAASATITFDTSSSVVSKGNDVSVSLTIDAEETIGEFEGIITYDSGILEYVEGGSFISGGEGILRVSDTEATEEAVKKKYTVKFTAKKVGISKISMSGKPIVYNYDEGKAMSISSNQITINVKAAKRANTDTSLSGLKISPGKLSPEFDPSVYNYTSEVSSEVTSLVVSADSKDSNASVAIKGNENLSDGENTVVLTVKAESGDTKDYSIIVKKEETNLQNEEDNTSNNTSDVFSVVSEDSKIFMESGYRYQIIEVEEGTIIPEGYEKTKLILDSLSIPAYTMENDLQSDFLLIYAMNELGEKSFYQYDRIEKTMQRYSGFIPKENTNVVTGDEVKVKEYNSKITQLSIIIAVLSALSALLTIGIIRMYLRTKGYRDDDLE